MTSPFDNDALPRNAANYAPLTPLTFIRRAADVHGDRCAVVYGDHSWTWRQTYRRCCKLASALRRRGIGKNDTVSVLAPNVPALYEAHFGVPMAGAVLNAINTRLDARTVALILAHGSARLVMAHRSLAPLLTDALLLLPGLLREKGRVSGMPQVVIIEDDEEPSDQSDPGGSAADVAALAASLNRGGRGEGGRGGRGRGGERGGVVTYEELVGEGDEQYEWEWEGGEEGVQGEGRRRVVVEDEWDAIALNYTSGTTAQPKGMAWCACVCTEACIPSLAVLPNVLAAWCAHIGARTNQPWPTHGGSTRYQAGSAPPRVPLDTVAHSLPLRAFPHGMVCTHRGAYLSVLANVLAWGLHALPGGQRPAPCTCGRCLSPSPPIPPRVWCAHIEAHTFQPWRTSLPGGCTRCQVGSVPCTSGRFHSFSPTPPIPPPQGMVCTYRGAYLSALANVLACGRGSSWGLHALPGGQSPMYLWTLPLFLKITPHSSSPCMNRKVLQRGAYLSAVANVLAWGLHALPGDHTPSRAYLSALANVLAWGLHAQPGGQRPVYLWTLPLFLKLSPHSLSPFPHSPRVWRAAPRVPVDAASLPLQRLDLPLGARRCGWHECLLQGGMWRGRERCMGGCVASRCGLSSTAMAGPTPGCSPLWLARMFVAGRYVEGQREVYGGVCCKQVWPLFHCNGWTYPWVLATVVGTNVCWREVCGEVGYGMVGCAAVGCGMVGRGTVGHGTIGRGTVGRGTVGRGTVGRGMVGRGTVGRGTVGRGTVGCGMEGCAVVRCGVEGCCVEGCGVEGCGVEGCGLVGCGLVGCVLVGCGTVTAASIFSLIPRHRVTHMCASPVVLPFLIHAPSSLTQPPPHLPRSQHLLSRSLAPRHPHVCRARGALLSHPRPRLPHPPPSPPLHQVTAASIFSHIPQHQVAATSIFSLIPRHRVTHMCAAPVVLSFLIHAPDSLQPCVPSPPHQVTAASIFSLIPRHRVTHMCAAPVVLSFLIHAPDSLRLPFLAAQRAQGRGGGDYSEGRWEGNSEGSREGRRGGYSEGNREGSSGGGQEARRVHVMTAGAAPPPAVLAGIEAMGFDVLHAYGLTETYGPAVVCEWQQERWRGADESERARLKARQVGKRGGGALEVDRGDGGIEAMGFEVMHAYGLMETYGPAVVCEWQQERWRGADESEQSRLKARQVGEGSVEVHWLWMEVMEFEVLHAYGLTEAYERARKALLFYHLSSRPGSFYHLSSQPLSFHHLSSQPVPFYHLSSPTPLSLLSLLLHPSPFTTSPSQPLLLPPLLAPPSLPPSPPHRQGVRCMALEGLAVMDPVTMRHVAADGRSMGEVMLRGNMVMKGYAADRGATEAAFRGGWFHSGDLAVMHPDGYIEVKGQHGDAEGQHGDAEGQHGDAEGQHGDAEGQHGDEGDRSKDIIISGGENVSSIAVEAVLYRHPSVLEAAVVARPDTMWGESVCAFVCRKPGQQHARVGEGDIIAFCRDHLPHYMAPRTVVFTELPKTATGKIQKFVLRERAKEMGNLEGGSRPKSRL
ncbi:unnamed protein product [Closterium sp. NIES-64]|nr:unnamed protein product [Closterium sp. NIES-64]